MAGFERIDGHLSVDGLKLDDIAAEFGTPLYVYSADAIRHAYDRFAQAVSGADSHVHFALKANSNMAVLRLLAKLGAGADIVSGGGDDARIGGRISGREDYFQALARLTLRLLMP